MTLEEARRLFAYGSWANARVFAAAEDLPAEQLEAAVASSFPSLRRTLGHVVAAEWIWLRRWLGEVPTAPPSWVEEADLAGLRAELAAIEAERSAYLAGLTDADLDRVVDYRTLAGVSSSSALGDLVRHVVNHSSYHRGQAATQLRQLGRTPPNTDLITYLREAG